MSQLARIGVAIDADLLASFDALIEKQGYENRSEAFRDLIRDRLIRAESEQPNKEVVGTLTLVYDHHQRNLTERITNLQHDHHGVVVSTLHVHLDHHNCLEVLILRGKSKVVRQLADLLVSIKGIQHGQLAVTAAEIGQKPKK
ncbi:MAG: nickel-responsive transcriptional regulator NikR [Acidobacteria bacterium]|jgi:CopG family transcriptional regulator, nickel-responsive regulator|nr:nickel-responsive transcriptional regulator NikR [Acidobacteriota bacterium]